MLHGAPFTYQVLFAKMCFYGVYSDQRKLQSTSPLTYGIFAGPLNVEETIQKLDLQLIYLWKVHSLDYYAAKENADPMFYALRQTSERKIRGIRPEEGEQSSDLHGTISIQESTRLEKSTKHNKLQSQTKNLLTRNSFERE